jgi:hypothetical protein
LEVIPAEAGIQRLFLLELLRAPNKMPAVTNTAAWAPACAGVTVSVVIPAKAGIQKTWHFVRSS